MSVNEKQHEYATDADITPVNLDDEFQSIYINLPRKWQNWTPTYTAATGTWSSVTTHIARYFVAGETCYFQIRAIGTTSNSTANIRFTLPLPPVHTATGDISGGCATASNGNNRSGFFLYNNTSGAVHVTRYDGSNYAAAVNTGVYVQGFYEIR